MNRSRFRREVIPAIAVGALLLTAGVASAQDDPDTRAGASMVAPFPLAECALPFPSGAIDHAGDVDFFRFSPQGTHDVEIELQFDPAMENLDLFLFDDTPPLATSDGVLVASSTSLNSNELITATVQGGRDYYFKVVWVSGNPNPSYGYNVRPVDFGNTRVTAVDIGGLASATFGDSGILPGDEDFFRITPATTTPYSMVMTEGGSISADVDLELQDAAGVPLAAATAASDANASERIERLLVAGNDYYVRVFDQTGTATSCYDLTIATKPATDFGSLPSQTVLFESIATAGQENYYKFTPSGNYTAVIDIGFTHVNGDLDLELLDANANPLAIAQSTSDNEQIRFPVAAGTEYYVRVYGFQGATNIYGISLSAETLVTNTNGGQGLGTLHNAMAGADALSGQLGTHVDVTFAPGTAGTITLNQFLPTITQEVSIIGPGAQDVSVSGADSFRILSVGGGAVCNVSGLTLRDGHADGTAGIHGGAAATEGNLTVSDCVFVSNRAADVGPGITVGGLGGAIHGGNASVLTLNDCAFSGNKAGRGGDAVAGQPRGGTGGSGGAVWSTGMLQVSRCAFSQNEAGRGGDGLAGSVHSTGGFGGHGGAISHVAGGFAISESRFDGNFSGDGGDGGAGSGGDGGVGGSGFALEITAASGTIRECAFTRNRGGNGGDGAMTSFGGSGGSFGEQGNVVISLNLSSGPNAIAMTNCTVAENISGRRGLNADGSTTLHNSFSQYGVSVFGSGTVDLVHCTLAGNRGFGDAFSGGAALNRGSNPILTIENCIVANNFLDDLNGTETPADLFSDIDQFGTNIVTSHFAGTASGPGTILVSDPLLESLAPNGGPGETLLPRLGSPAIDAAAMGPNTPAFDARLLPRPVALGPDIGAVESRRLVVNTRTDENDGIHVNDVSLRDALDAFVFLGAGEEGVFFDANVFTPGIEHVIVLQHGPILGNVSNGGIVVDGTSNLLPDRTPGIVVDGQDASRLFEIAGGGDVTLDGLWLRNGRSGTDGGGIRNEGTLRLNRCHVTDCRTEQGADGLDGTPGSPAGTGGGDSANGGAIFVAVSGDLRLTDCLLMGNRTGHAGRGGDAVDAGDGGGGGNAGDGGAIFSLGPLEATRTVFVSNRAGSGGRGGGADQGNGGTPGDGGDGGAVRSSGADVFAVCEFRNNDAGDGGRGGSSFGTASAGGNGGHAGALWITAGTVRRCLFDFNLTGAGALGGSFLSLGGGTATSGESGEGGAVVANTTGDVLIENSTFVRNFAVSGASASTRGDLGAVSATGSGTDIVTIRHCTITGNHGEFAGGIGVSTNAFPAHPSFVPIIENTILFGNTSATGNTDLDGLFEVEGANIVGALSATSQIVGTGTASSSDPLLAPLDDHGGPTRSFYPYPSSPAVNAAVVTASSPSIDQRGHHRPVGSAPDIGAVETDVGLVITDSEPDGMDDTWETLFGLVVGIDDGAGDKDGDGSTNLEEFLNHTNPCDPHSLFEVTAYIDAGVNVIGHPQFEVRWTSWPGLNYATEISTDHATWHPDQMIQGAPASLETGTIVVMPAPRQFVHVARP